MEITPLKQHFHHSCLVTCLMMISKMTDQSIEERIFMEGERRDFEFYINSILESFAENTMLSVEVYVDNKFFTDKLSSQQNRKNKRIKFINEKISLNLINRLLADSPVILHIDGNLLGDQSHVSHYIVIESKKDTGKYTVIDPYTGKFSQIKPEVLEEAISSLKNYVKMCPLAIRKIEDKKYSR